MRSARLPSRSVFWAHARSSSSTTPTAGCVKPLAGPESCKVQHTGYAVAGRMKVVMDDGSEQEIGSGDMYVIRPRHDAWIVGDETFVGVDFSSDIERFAKEQ